MRVGDPGGAARWRPRSSNSDHHPSVPIRPNRGDWAGDRPLDRPGWPISRLRSGTVGAAVWNRGAPPAPKQLKVRTDPGSDRPIQPSERHRRGVQAKARAEECSAGCRVWVVQVACSTPEPVCPAPYRVAFKNTSVQKHYSLGGTTAVPTATSSPALICPHRHISHGVSKHQSGPGPRLCSREVASCRSPV